MSLSRRTFISSLPIMIGSMTIPTLPNFDASDWTKIKALYDIDKYPYLHLNSGSAGIMPTAVRLQLEQVIDQLNQNPPYEIWDGLVKIREDNRNRLADIIGAKASEVTVVRNTTEAINLIVHGTSVSSNDRIVCASSDYPYAVGSCKMLAKKHQADLTIIPLDDIDTVSDDEIIERYRNNLNAGAKLLVLSHMSFREGRILPVKEITQIAHENGAKVLLDAAHTYCHIDHDVKELGIDYYATSLHKWLTAPHGSGLLYISEEEIEAINPPLSLIDEDKGIEKFSHLGTRAFQNEVGINYALTFQEEIGLKKKRKRLRKLTDYWTNQVEDLPNIRFHTPRTKGKYGAVSAFSINRIGTNKLLKTLQDDYQIHAKPSGYPGKGFIRITPNLFTLESDLDHLVASIKDISSQY